MANLGDITPEMPKTSYVRVDDETNRTEREDYQEDRHPRRERPVPMANQAEGPSPQNDQPVSLAQLKELMTDFRQSLVSQVKNMMGETSKNPVAETSKTHPVSKSPRSKARGTTPAKSKAGKSPHLNWHKISRQVKNSKAPIQPRREPLVSESNQAFRDARDYLRAKRQQEEQVELSDTASTPTMKDGPRSSLKGKSVSTRLQTPTPIPKPPLSAKDGSFREGEPSGSKLCPKVQGCPGAAAMKSPFSVAILTAPRTDKVKALHIESYDGSGDPDDHLATYKYLMYAQSVDDATWCKYFPATLKGIAQKWFSSLPDHCINNFTELSMVFSHHFMANKQEKKTSMHLGKIIQGQNETLRSYVKRFNLEMLQIPGLPEGVAFDNFVKGLYPSRFKFEMVRKKIQTLPEILVEAESYIHATEICSATKPDKKDSARPGEGGQKKEEKKKQVWTVEDGQKGQKPPKKRRAYEAAYEFNKEPHAILMEIKDKFDFEAPQPLRGSAKHRNTNKYCHYHKDVGHDTNDCFNLKKLLDRLAAKGMLEPYVKKSKFKFQRKVESHQEGYDTDPEVVAMISGGFASGGPTIRGTKESLRSLSQVMISEGKPEPFPEVLIGEKDRRDLQTPHDDPLVVELKVANLKVRRILIDTGSSTDIISLECLEKLRFKVDSLQPINHPIIGFGGGIIHPVGTVTLPLRIGTKEQPRHMIVKFLVVRELAAYNIILGRPTLNSAKAVIVPHLMLMKFVCNNGDVGAIYGDQHTARECYLTTLRGVESEPRRDSLEERPTKKPRGKAVLEKHELFMIGAAKPDDLRPQPAGEFKSIVLDESQPERTIQVGASLEEALGQRLEQLLKDFRDVFAFTVHEMPGIDPSISSHKLNVLPGMKPVRQKKRNHGGERDKAAAEEVKKLLEARFIRPCYYPEWVANVVLVPKPNKTWRMCVDYTDLNKACPKDGFPLPKIDQLVDSTAGHALMSFMDANSGFHQIPMHRDDQEKTAFITSQGLFCYNVMPFGLKNAPATFQRLVNTVFQNQVGRNLEAYIDDIIVKSKERSDHLADLRETFESLRQYNMKLNPKKCVFGVEAGKFLGFLIDQRGVEANPDKIKAVENMTSPRNIKEVQRLTGCLAALGRFLSRSGDKCHYFFDAVKKKSKFEWTNEAEAAFVQLKLHMHTLPRLVSPLQGEVLYMYLAVSEHALSAVLVAEREGVQHPIYFVSHILRNAELRYPLIEKFGLALYMASKKLRAYFKAHPIVVYTDQQLKQPFTRLESSGRMVKWAVELNAFDITYEPRKAIKGQALADFVAELTRPILEGVQPSSWKLFVDGSSTQNGCGAGIICTSPEGDVHEYALRFKFQASNNEAEYEALLTGLRMCLAAGAEEVEASSDSQLIVSQVNGDYEARDSAMIKYLARVQEEVTKLRSFVLLHVPRSENSQADALSKLASSALNDTPRTVLWEIKEKRSIDDEEVLTLDRSQTWMDSILRFKIQGELPTDKKEAKAVERRAAWFEIFKGELYKKAHSKPYLKCVTPNRGKEILEDLHKGLCSSHIGGRALAEKTVRTGYYWPTLKEDAMWMVRRCEKCQRFAKLIHRPTNDLTPITSPLPFAKWGMDILGPYTPATGQRRYVFVAVDYFSKWVEAEAVRGIKTSDVRQFIWKNLITRFGVPQAMVFDNGPQFETPHLRKWLEDQGIAHCFASVGRPQTNGQVESFNKIISDGIKKKLEKAKGLWADELPNVLWSIRTTAKSSTGETPFMMVYGAEAVLPIEMCEPTLRVMLYDEAANWEAMKMNLDFLPETRGNALLRQAIYKLRMAREYNKHVKNRPVRIGDYVLRKMAAQGRGNEEGKLTPNWEGPYRVAEAVHDGTYRLETLNGEAVPRSWNMDNLRKFYF